MRLTFADVLKAMRGRRHFIAAKLAAVADQYAVTCEFAGSSAALLGEVGLEPDDVGPLDVRQAEEAARAYSYALDRAYTQRPAETLDNAAEATVAPLSETKKRQALFGFPVTAVIRWMGNARWNIEQCRAALRGLHIDLAEGTVYAQLRAGLTGDRGDPAELTADHVAQLVAATKKAD